MRLVKRNSDTFLLNRFSPNHPLLVPSFRFLSFNISSIKYKNFYPAPANLKKAKTIERLW